MFKEFKAFLFRGNVVDLAVGVVIGTAFGAIVASLVKDVIMPIVAAIFKAPDFSALAITINGSALMYGNFINAVVAFVIVAAAIFFLVVKPMNMFMKKPESAPTTKKCRECISEIPLEAKRCGHCTQVAV